MNVSEAGFTPILHHEPHQPYPHVSDHRRWVLSWADDVLDVLTVTIRWVLRGRHCFYPCSASEQTKTGKCLQGHTTVRRQRGDSKDSQLWGCSFQQMFHRLSCLWHAVCSSPVLTLSLSHWLWHLRVHGCLHISSCEKWPVRYVQKWWQFTSTLCHQNLELQAR